MVAEALAQAVGLAHGKGKGGQVRLAALQGVRLLQEVFPGDRLHIELHEEACLGTWRRFFCRALRGGALVAEATISVVERKSSST